MLRELRNHVPPTVTIVRAAFEDLAPGASYDLVFAAAAMHWTDPVSRWERVAAQLVPGGAFACFGGQVQLADPAVEVSRWPPNIIVHLARTTSRLGVRLI
jgi:trans-aconitate methyltransferase